ncbi:MAG: type III pantothenate kinase [Saprospiraceae bacterium]|nr:type III pantothenate kinase [Saprospiraceae bacterium]
MYWLAVDIGNSTVLFGVFKDDELVYQWSIETNIKTDVSYYERSITEQLIERQVDIKGLQSVISCVVPDLLVSILELLGWLTGKTPLTVQFDLYPGISLQIDHPLELGTDLFVNAIAAKHLHKSNSIIVDFGTALTFTVLTKEGKLVGVSIAPGLETAVRSLYQGTAQLPKVPLAFPKSVIGKNTVESIQGGVLVGYVGLVSHLITSIRHEFGLDYIAIATGSMTGILPPLDEIFEVTDPDLTLKGLQIYAADIYTSH